MKNLKKIIVLSVLSLATLSCSKSDNVANDVVLEFNNTFKETTIVLGDAHSINATKNTSAEGQVHHFSELKYVVSNIRLVKTDGQEVPYNINNLDDGAVVVNQSKPETLKYVLQNIPAGDYKQIKFGLGVKPELNTLDQERFPKFYALAGANDTSMMWEWGTGYRFTKIEGFYDTDNKTLSVHTGSTLEESEDDTTVLVQGVNAYREIVLNLPSTVSVGNTKPIIRIKADFDKLLNGKIYTIKLDANNAIPNIHTAVNMTKFVDNLGGNGTNDVTGMFSIISVNN